MHGIANVKKEKAKKRLELWIFVNPTLPSTAVPYDSKTNNYTLHNIICLRSDVFRFTNHLQQPKTLYRSYSRPLHVEKRKRQLGLCKIRPMQVNSVTRYICKIYTSNKTGKR